MTAATTPSNKGPVSVHGSFLINPLQPRRLREELILSVDSSDSTTLGETNKVFSGGTTRVFNANRLPRLNESQINPLHTLFEHTPWVPRSRAKLPTTQISIRVKRLRLNLR